MDWLLPQTAPLKEEHNTNKETEHERYYPIRVI